MNHILLASGVILFLAVITDVVKTTLSLHGGGWLTSPFSNALWKMFLKVSGNNGRSPILEHAGYLILVSIILFWVFAIWGSFVLLLMSEPGSIIKSDTKMPADIWQKIYYAGFTISTLGVGDFESSSNLWRVFTVIYSFSGLVLITMSITYFVPVLSGVTDKRKLGILLGSMGNDPQKIILNNWDGSSFNRLISQLSDLSDMLIQHTHNHKAFPIVHYYHTTDPKKAVVINIAAFFEALFILDTYVKQEKRPLQNDLSSIYGAMENYFEMIKNIMPVSHVKNIPAPVIDKLVESGLVNEEVKDMVLNQEVQRKRYVLAGLVELDGWSWEDVIQGR